MVDDVGGTHVKILATGHETRREFACGPAMTAEEMVSRVQKVTEGLAEPAHGSAALAGGDPDRWHADLFQRRF